MILADENINFKIIKAIREKNIDVLSIRENYSGISDSEVINLAVSTSRILLTEDKDFGEWVFAHNEKISVVFLRYEHKDILKIITSILLIFKNDINNLIGKFVTVTPNKIRIRQI